MIVPPTSVRVLVATKPVDFRKGMIGLAAYVQHELQSDPFCGVVYVFRAKRADRVKLLFWDQTGLCLLSKRLEKGRFARLFSDTGPLRLTVSELQLFLEGCEWVGQLALSPPVLEREELAIAARI